MPDEREAAGAAQDETGGGAGARARRGTGGWRAARWARRAVQILTFAVFVYLLFAGLQRLEPQPYASIFFRFDPLAALATMLAARAWLAPFALAFITLGLTLVARPRLVRLDLPAWARCSAGCASARRGGWPARVPPALRRVKYVLLGVDRRAGRARQPHAARPRPALAAHADR